MREKLFRRIFDMRRNLLKVYAIKSLEKSQENFIKDQSCINSLGFDFNVIFISWRNELGIIVYDIEEGSKNDKILKKRGFDTEGA